MVQIKKEKIRQVIINEALNKFSRNGYRKTKISDIAKSSGIATGNIYHYFKSKDELFQHILPKNFLDTLSQLLENKINAISGVKNIYSLPVNSKYELISKEMLSFILEHRLKLIIITTGLTGSPYESYKEIILENVYNFAVNYYKSINPTFNISKQQSFNIKVIYKNLFLSLSEILINFDDKTELLEALNTHMKYHLQGLNNLFN